MADIRIKDLTTTASSTASDDFIAVDGTTNGTRKLNAFSPTFGGNATVTGTLTGNSTITAAGNIKSSLSSSGATAGILIAENSAAAATGNQASVFLPTSTGASTYWQLNARQNSATLNDQTLRVVFGGVAQHTYFNASDLSVQSGITLKVLDTTASTSTSSGALVVSGGVGVAGNIWTGGQVNLAATSVEASTGINFGVANATSRDIVFFGDGTRGGMLRGYHDGSNSARLGFGYWASSGDTYTSVIDITGSATTSSQLVAIAGTAGSTSTTSGALTVAGGMGVAEAVNAGTFFGLVDGVTAPATGSGYARIYVDSADGDLKVKFGDGTVKTIATDS